MDWGHDDRDYTAGHPERAPRLAPADWTRMAHMSPIAEPGAGQLRRTYRDPSACRRLHRVLGRDRQVLADIPHEVAGLCLDTGHAYYSGMDPVPPAARPCRPARLRAFQGHRPQVYERVMGQRIRFFEACAEGVMCPIGRGVLDYDGHPRGATRDRLPGLHHDRAGARSAQFGHQSGRRKASLNYLTAAPASS